MSSFVGCIHFMWFPPSGSTTTQTWRAAVTENIARISFHVAAYFCSAVESERVKYWSDRFRFPLATESADWFPCRVPERTRDADRLEVVTAHTYCFTSDCCRGMTDWPKQQCKSKDEASRVVNHGDLSPMVEHGAGLFVEALKGHQLGETKQHVSLWLHKSAPKMNGCPFELEQWHLSKQTGTLYLGVSLSLGRKWAKT